jgi:hypothetical protein
VVSFPPESFPALEMDQSFDQVDVFGDIDDLASIDQTVRVD